MSTRKCPDCDNPIKTCRELGGCRPKPERIEAHGVKGMASKPWRRTFPSAAALHSWAEKNSAEVYGQRFLDAGDAPLTSVERKDMAAAKERQAQRIAGIEARKTARKERLHAELGESQFGTAQPQIRLTGGDGEHYRAVHAELLQLAAAVEFATIPTREGWLVRVEMDGDFAGRVVVELIEGDAAEAERAMAILNEVVRRAHLAQAKAVPA